MEPRDDRKSLDGRDSTQDFSSEMSSHSEDNDVEKFHLLGEDSESIRRTSWRDTWSWSTRVLTSVTVFNIILFLMTVGILSSTKKARSLSDQDLWKATSYYCTYTQEKDSEAIY